MSLRSLLSLAPKPRARHSHRPLQLEALEPRLCLAAVPALSSLPAAAHTIYLDFDGQTVQGTPWNQSYNQSKLVAKPYDIDGNTAMFSATELARIEEAWRRVSEDFVPFNVNVTTVDPGIEALRRTSATDTRWGVRVIVTNESTMVASAVERTGAGGIALVNSFAWNSDTPAWVFTTGGKSIAEAASHEVGHTLGLEHDGHGSTAYYAGHGSGATGWAPIMGVGYSQTVTQWDNGAYNGTSNGGSDANFGRGAGDLSVILAGHGLTYRVDDHSNTSTAATRLSLSGATASASGIVERASDVDVFSFTTDGGNVSLSIAPQAVGANLDVKVDLYNASGVKVASSNPSGTLDAGLSLTLAAGTFYLHVDGAGSANYSDYGSIGRYTINGTIASPAIAAAAAPSSLARFSISDIVVSEQAQTATFDVSLTGAIAAPASVIYATASGTAAAGQDFTSKSARLTFQPGGAAVARVSIALTNDSAREASEKFFVNLTSAAGAMIADAQGAATIVDNDAPATGSLSISSTSGAEGNTASGKTFKFAVRLAQPVGHTVSVRYQTADGSATSGSDYRAASGTLTFAPGETTKYVAVTVFGDRVLEGHEAFLLLLSQPVGATLTTAYGVATVFNDDAATAMSAAPELIVDPISYFEAPGEATGAWAIPAEIRIAVERELDGNRQEISPAAVDRVLRALDDWLGVLDDAWLV